MLKNLIFIVLITCFIGVAVVLARWGIADYYARQSEQIVTSWQNDHSLQTEGAIREVIALDEKALSFAPRHRTYLFRLGQMHGALYRINRIRHRESGSLSLTYLRDSIAVRPEWALTWVELAQTKVAMREYDDELHQAMINAAKFGPWEPLVHSRLTWAGVSSYQALPTAIQGVVRGNIERGLRGPDPTFQAEVVEAIRLRSSGLTVDLVWDLGLFLGSTEWPVHSIRSMTDLTLLLWPVFNAEIRRSLKVKLSQAVVLDRGTNILKKMRKTRHLSLVCPYLPREARYERFCASRKYIGR